MTTLFDNIFSLWKWAIIPSFVLAIIGFGIMWSYVRNYEVENGKRVNPVNSWNKAMPVNVFDSLKRRNDSNYLYTIMNERYAREHDIYRSYYEYAKSGYNIFQLRTQYSFPRSSCFYIDQKVSKYLYPGNKILYSIDGVGYKDYDSVINILKRNVITDTMRLNSKTAILLWGKTAGKNGVLLINTEHGPVKDSILINK
ncbi:hypothetical protein [Parabacteroides sp. FAFU027]|uniref:hypothetical protein n=1 Tax=Parabacteroides sp. FAFU027 TaxID=2922715 RepID=UPI001FAEB8E1|nr:hypothetical protein [Parabacteroides sp. FAFU027]